MFETYDQVQGWMIIGGWLWAVVFLLLWVIQIKAYRGVSGERDKAEADARELKTALDERLTKLRAADFRMGELEREIESMKEPRVSGSVGPLLSAPLGNPAKKAKKTAKKAVLGKKKK